MKIKFVPQNIELDINPGQSVLDLAQQNDIHIQSVCKGIPSCAECRVYIKEGEHNVMPPQPKELELIGTAYFVDQRRLSCQLRCFGDVVIDLTEQNEKQHRSTKNPQGRYVKEREDSQARMGNVLEELTEEEMKIEAEINSTSSGSQTSHKPKQKLDNRSFYKIDERDLSKNPKSQDQNSKKHNNDSRHKNKNNQRPNNQKNNQQNPNAKPNQNMNAKNGNRPNNNSHQGAQNRNQNPNQNKGSHQHSQNNRPQQNQSQNKPTDKKED